MASRRTGLSIWRRRGRMIARSTAVAGTGTTRNGAMSGKSVEHLRQGFLTDEELAESKTFPRLHNWTFALIGAFAVTGLLWSASSRLDTVITASGKLTTSPATLLVQPVEMGVVRSVDVVVGQIVRQGQTLATLDSTFAAADLRQMEARFDSRTWETRRLHALLAGAPAMEVKANEHVDELQRQIFLQQKMAYEARLAEHDAMLARLSDQLVHAKMTQVVLHQRLGTLGEIVGLQEQLKNTEGGAAYRVLVSKDSYQGVAVEFQREVSQETDMDRQIAVQRAQRDTWIQDWREKLTTELQTAERDLDETAQQLEKAHRRARLITLTAPADGVVLDLAARSVGSVVTPAEPMVILVPLDTPLTAEVDIAEKDVGALRVGQIAKIKVDAFPSQEHGMLDGTLETISADAFEKDKKSDPVYRGRLSLASTHLAKMKPGSRLLPGEKIQAEIMSDQRSVLSYFIDPVWKGVVEGLHEP